MPWKTAFRQPKTFAGIWSKARDGATERRAASGDSREYANTSKVWGSWKKTVAVTNGVFAVSAGAFHVTGLFFIKESIMNVLKAKNYLLGFGLALMGVGSMAQTAAVSFSGAVNSASCVLTVSATGGTQTQATSFTLPTASSSALGTSGNTAGKTTFYMGVTSCSTAAAITPKLYLSSAGASGGYLTTGITNVVLELLDASGNSLSLTSSPTAYPGTTWASFTPAATGTYYEKSFSVQYRATGAGGSGTVSGASMTVALLYS